MIPQGQIDDYRRRAQQNILGRILNQPRQPMDERLPSGQSAQDLLSVRGSDAVPRIRPQSPITDVTAASQGAQSAQPSPRIAISSQPARGIVGALNLPEPPADIRSPNDMPPNMSFPVPEVQTPAVGGSIRGSKLDRDIMLREAMGTADPESKVRISGDQIDVSPPPMKGALPHRSRWATAGEAAVNALGSADPDRPLYSLGQGVGAAVTGAVSPRSGAKINRRFDTQRLDNDIARGLKVEGAQSDLASADALRRQRELEPILQGHKMEQDAAYRNAELELERQKAAGAIGQREYERRRDALNRESREKISQLDRESRERLGGRSGRDDSYADQKSEYEWQTKNAENDAKRTAAMQEAQALTATAEDHQKKVSTARTEVLRIDALIKSVPPQIPGVGSNPEYVALKTQRDQAEKIQNDEQNKMDTAYKQANEKKSEAARYPALPAPPKRHMATAQPPAPPGVTEASVRAEAKRRGQDAEAAVKKAREFGWIQ